MEKTVNVESCVIYRSYMAAIDELDSDVEKWQIMEAIIHYALDGTMPNLTDLTRGQRMIWLMAQPTIDSNRQNRILGARGGRPRKSISPNSNRVATGQSEANPGKSGGTVYPPIYVPPDDLRRLQMQSLVDDLRHD